MLIEAVKSREGREQLNDEKIAGEQFPTYSTSWSFEHGNSSRKIIGPVKKKVARVQLEIRLRHLCFIGSGLERAGLSVRLTAFMSKLIHRLSIPLIFCILSMHESLINLILLLQELIYLVNLECSRVVLWNSLGFHFEHKGTARQRVQCY